MRAITVRAPGGPEVLELSEVPDPVPGDGDLLVRVRAAGVNRADLLQRLGRYPAPPAERKHEACRSLGATHVLRREDVPARLPHTVREAAGKGADLVFDLVGGAYLEANIAALAQDGRLVSISTLSGSRATLDLGAV